MPTRSRSRAPVPVLLRLACAIGLLLAMALPAVAADAPKLTDRITDETGVLAQGRTDITTALGTLERDHAVRLWVLFTRTTGSTSITAFADQVAAVNTLGSADALLVVALDDRTDSIWVSNGLTQISNAEIDAIISGRVEPQLAAGSYAAAVIGAADGLGQAAGGTVPVTTAPPATPRATQAPASQGGSDTGTTVFTGVIAALLIVAGAYIVIVYWMRRRNETRTAEERDRQTGDLARRANHDLIAADEGVRDAQQELGFVEAEFDEPDVAPFRTAVDQARDEVKAAFTVRQQLDDEIPEDASTRQKMLEEILRHTVAATALLKAQEDRLQQLRDVRRRAPEVLDQLSGQLDGLTARLTAAHVTLDGLTAFAPASWESVKGHGAEADKRVAFARDAVARGRAALGQTDQRAVGAAIRDAQGAIGETTSLLDAVEGLAASLADARTRLPDELAAAAADIETARQALTAGGAGPEQQQKLAQAESLLAAARTAANAVPPDVLAAFHAATQANATADSIVAAAKEEAARIARRQAVLDGAIRSAAMAVARASDFVETRRGGVGREARTRIAEAQRQLDTANATQSTDPDGALAAAQRAQSLANDAYLIASQDFTQFDQRGPTGGGADVGATILGAIIGGMLSGGGRRGGWGGGGWGGTPWGSPPRSGGTGLGGFGGGGGGGRAIGGGWGGLGGRSRGGRW